MATIDYLQGSERPTAALMNRLFAGLEAKLTTLLGGRSFFLAQTAVMPQYLIGRTFFFTAGPAIYAPRVPGYVESNTTTSPVATPYDHTQFIRAQSVARLQPGTAKTIRLSAAGSGFLLNDVVTMEGGVVAPGGSPASIQVTSRGASGEILGFTVVSHGSYSVLPPTPNTPINGGGGHGLGAVFNLELFQCDTTNKVAPIVSLGAAWDASVTYQAGYACVASDGTNYHLYRALSANTNKAPASYPAVWSKAVSGVTPPENDVGFFEASLAAHSFWLQQPGDKKPGRYYLQDGATVPEKHLRMALAEIIIEGVQNVTIEAAWDKYSCFRIHNLTAKPVTVTFADTGYVVNLPAFGCATVRRDWTETGYANYRRGGNYFFHYEGGDPRAYWFFPTLDRVQTTSPYGHYKTIGAGRRATNSMQANNLANVALLFDWVQYFTRTPDATAVFAGWNDDAAVQCDVYPFYQHLLGDPGDPKTIVGDLLHHKGDILIVRISLTKKDPVTPANPLVTYDRVTFNGYATIVADFAKHKLRVTENAAGNLVVTNADTANTVLLCPLGTNLFKVGDDVDAGWRLNGYPSVKGVRLPVTIENAIFEAQPEQSWLDNTTLSASAPQLIQQPFATVTTPQKTWTDFVTGAQQTVEGTPQTSLNWNTNVRGLLTLPTIVDGGSGYAVNDLLQLEGGTWDAATGGGPAVVEVADVTGGAVTRVRIVRPGNYITPPDNPNVPRQISPTERQGNGVRLGGISVPIRTLSGIHKLTVADLLKLDWWGDPRAGGQSSEYLAITDRKLMLTPQGLVLTFTETTAPLPGDTIGQPATLPTYASGQRGQPRRRALRFRGHGWGFVGGPTDTETTGFYNGNSAVISVPPSAKSGWVSPRRGRAIVTDGYAGEVVAPQGADFSVGEILPRQSNIELLTRVPAGALSLSSSLGRFWRADWLDMAAKFLPQTELSAAAFYQWLTVDSGTGGAAPLGAAMTLLPEMYNALARAVNAVTRGTPLQWQCLFFSVAGRTLNLDSKYAVSFGSYSYPSGSTTADGTLVTAGGRGYTPLWIAPKPMTQACAFDLGSLYHQLCDQLGMEILTENELPEVPDMLGKYSAPAVYCDVRKASGAVIQVQGSGQYVPFTGTIQVAVETELLSTVALLAGEATGSRCLGTYDRTKYNQVVWLPGMPGTDPGPVYPVFAGMPAGGYYVADDGSGYVATADGQTNVFVATPVPNQAYWPGGTLDLAANFEGYRWIRIETLKRVVEKFGFPFLWNEVCTPLTLEYFEDPTVQAVIAGGSARQPVSGLLSWTDWNGGGKVVLDYIAGLTSLRLNFVAEATPWHGTLIKFCVAREEAAWKYNPVPAPYEGTPKTGYVLNAPTSPTTTLSGGYGTPAEIVDISSRQDLSPIFRYLSAGGDISGALMVLTWDEAAIGYPPFYGTTPGGFYSTGPQSGYLCLGTEGTVTYYLHTDGPRYGANIAVTVSADADLGDGLPSEAAAGQLAVQYLAKDETVGKRLFSGYYAEGTLLDQVQTLAFNLYSTQPLAPIPVLMSGVMAWRRPTDWWGSLDTAYFAGAGSGYLPWVFVEAADSFVQTVTEYYDGAGRNGMTILTPPNKDQRYWCCFSVAAFDLTAINFG